MRPRRPRTASKTETKSETKTEADGVQLTVDGSATVKIIDNSKDFIDTRDHWSRDEVNYVVARTGRRDDGAVPQERWLKPNTAQKRRGGPMDRPSGVG